MTSMGIETKLRAENARLGRTDEPRTRKTMQFGRQKDACVRAEVRGSVEMLTHWTSEPASAVLSANINTLQLKLTRGSVKFCVPGLSYSLSRHSLARIERL